MSNFVMAVMASLLVSVVSLAGILVLFLGQERLKSFLIPLVGFGAGGLMGGAFFHLLPETIEAGGDPTHIFGVTLAGFIIFFLMERYLFWRHCHKGRCDVHAFTHLNLIGDSIHNLIDGLIIGASFYADPYVGMMTTLAIVMHEVPQELGDFSILLYGGMSKTRALLLNFSTALTAVIGTVLGYTFTNQMNDVSRVLMPFAAGGFLYIAACDLIPSIHREPDRRAATHAMIVFVAGVALMFLFKIIHSH